MRRKRLKVNLGMLPDSCGEKEREKEIERERELERALKKNK